MTNEWTLLDILLLTLCLFPSEHGDAGGHNGLNKSMFSCGALKWLCQILNPVGLTLSLISESLSTGLVMFLLLSELSCCHEIFQQLLILKDFKAVFERRFYPYLVFCPNNENDLKKLSFMLFIPKELCPPDTFPKGIVYFCLVPIVLTQPIIY